VVSSGADGQVRRYDTSPEALASFADPSLLYDHDSEATCLAVSKEVPEVFPPRLSSPWLTRVGGRACDALLQREWIAVGFSDNQVHLLKYPSGEFEKILIRLQWPVRHVAFSPDGLYLAVAGEYASPLPSSLLPSFKAHYSITSVAQGEHQAGEPGG
jgi:WD40 repeat protein